MLSRQIVHLRAVGGHVVQLPRLAVTRDELPVAVSHGPVAFVLPEQRRRAVQRLALEGGANADTLRRQDRPAVALLRVCRGGHVDARSHDVDHVTDLVRDRPARLKTRGQCAISGVAIPPSWTKCLYSRSGVLLALAQHMPYAEYESAAPIVPLMIGSPRFSFARRSQYGPPSKPKFVSSPQPPLSDRNRISVSSSTFASASACTMRPMVWSIESIIAAYTALRRSMSRCGSSLNESHAGV